MPSLLAWICVGSVAGFVANLFVHNSKADGCLASIVVGMLGSLIGGLLVTFIQTGQFDINVAFTTFNLTSIIISTIGAIVFLIILNLFKD